jgi:hypothetical protein
MQTLHDIDINTGPLVPARDVLKRYGVVGRTLDRWVANPELKFPRPLVVTGAVTSAKARSSSGSGTRPARTSGMRHEILSSRWPRSVRVLLGA